MIDFRILSPMEKVFLDTAPAADARQTRFEGFQNECVSFQAAVMSDDAPARLPVMLRAQSPLGSRVRVRSVRSVPVTLATLPGAVLLVRDWQGAAWRRDPGVIAPYD